MSDIEIEKKRNDAIKQLKFNDQQIDVIHSWARRIKQKKFYHIGHIDSLLFELADCRTIKKK